MLLQSLVFDHVWFDMPWLTTIYGNKKSKNVFGKGNKRPF